MRAPVGFRTLVDVAFEKGYIPSPTMARTGYDSRSLAKAMRIASKTTFKPYGAGWFGLVPEDVAAKVKSIKKPDSVIKPVKPEPYDDEMYDPEAVPEPTPDVEATPLNGTPQFVQGEVVKVDPHQQQVVALLETLVQKANRTNDLLASLTVLMQKVWA